MAQSCNPLVHQSGERLFVTSLEISNRFGKRHDNVLRAIENIECSQEFRRLNFEESTYNNRHNKAQPMFEITRDGFVFLCMGFTGAQAALWKERYIQAFNQMEAALRAPAPQPAPASLVLAQEVGQLKDMVAMQNQMIIGLYQQVDCARRGQIRSLSRMLTMQEQQQRLIAVQEKREARELILQLEAEGLPRSIISQRTGRTLNHVRQVIFQDRQARGITPPAAQLALGV